MKKGLIAIVAVSLLALLSMEAFAWVDEGRTWQDKLDDWFAGIGKEMDQAGESFAKIFLNASDSNR